MTTRRRTCPSFLIVEGAPRQRILAASSLLRIVNRVSQLRCPRSFCESNGRNPLAFAGFRPAVPFSSWLAPQSRPRRYPHPKAEARPRDKRTPTAQTATLLGVPCPRTRCFHQFHQPSKSTPHAERRAPRALPPLPDLPFTPRARRSRRRRALRPPARPWSRCPPAATRRASRHQKGWPA